MTKEEEDTMPRRRLCHKETLERQAQRTVTEHLCDQWERHNLAFIGQVVRHGNVDEADHGWAFSTAAAALGVYFESQDAARRRI